MGKLKPLTGFFHFYSVNDGFVPLNGMCQCPLTGFLHFYAVVGSGATLLAPEVCQCPLTGFLHFYPVLAAGTLVHLLCQCPLTGFLHFYGNIRIYWMKQILVCQCPLTGFLHFYVKVTGLGEVKANVSMPFNGLPSFLR